MKLKENINMNDRYRFRFWLESENRWFYFGFESFMTYKDQIEKALVDGLKIYQSTGLEDKNGKLIFEGDIIRVKFYNPIKYKTFKVIVDELSLCVAYTDGIIYERLTHHDDSERLEVIGNIYENADLLKEGKE